MKQQELETLLEKKAKELGAEEDIILLKAHIQVESNWNEYAVRYEPSFPYLFSPQVFAKKNGISLDTETTMQKISWGLFQVMGCVIREMGYEDALPKCLDPAKNMEMGIKYYLKRCKKFPDITDRIAAYNAGSPKRTKDGKEYINQKYVSRVLGQYHRYLDLEPRKEV